MSRVDVWRWDEPAADVDGFPVGVEADRDDPTTMNWRGRPLKTHQIIVETIASTTTATGLTVQCVLDTDEYPTGLKYTTTDIDALPLTRHQFHGEWNYTLTPPDTP